MKKTIRNLIMLISIVFIVLFLSVNHSIKVSAETTYSNVVWNCKTENDYLSEVSLEFDSSSSSLRWSLVLWDYNQTVDSTNTKLKYDDSPHNLDHVKLTITGLSGSVKYDGGLYMGNTDMEDGDDPFDSFSSYFEKLPLTANMSDLTGTVNVDGSLYNGTIEDLFEWNNAPRYDDSLPTETIDITGTTDKISLTDPSRHYIITGTNSDSYIYLSPTVENSVFTLTFKNLNMENTSNLSALTLFDGSSSVYNMSVIINLEGSNVLMAGNQHAINVGNGSGGQNVYFMSKGGSGSLKAGSSSTSTGTFDKDYINFHLLGNNVATSVQSYDSWEYAKNPATFDEMISNSGGSSKGHYLEFTVSGANNPEYTPWTDSTTLPTDGGKYELMTDVTLSSDTTIDVGTTIDMHNHHLKLDSATLTAEAALTFEDSLLKNAGGASSAPESLKHVGYLEKISGRWYETETPNEGDTLSDTVYGGYITTSSQNTATSALNVSSGGSVRFDNITLVGCYITDSGNTNGVIDISNSSTFEAIDSVFVLNCGPYLIKATDSELSLTNCSFTKNESTSGSLLYAYSMTSYNLENVEITDNTCNEYVLDYSNFSPVLKGVSIYENWVIAPIYILDDNLTVSGKTRIYDNHPSSDKGLSSPNNEGIILELYNSGMIVVEGEVDSDLLLEITGKEERKFLTGTDIDESILDHVYFCNYTSYVDVYKVEEGVPCLYSEAPVEPEWVSLSITSSSIVVHPNKTYSFEYSLSSNNVNYVVKFESSSEYTDFDTTTIDGKTYFTVKGNKNEEADEYPYTKIKAYYIDGKLTKQYLNFKLSDENSTSVTYIPVSYYENHITSYVDPVPSTCEEYGVKGYFKCKYDKDEYIEAVLSDSGSSYNPGEVITYTQEEIDEYGVPDALLAPKHSFTNYVSDDNATCIADGTKTAQCENCTETDTITDVDSHLTAIHARSEGSELNVITPATCEDEGEGTYVCSLCGETISVTIDALGHEYSEDFIIDTPATCTEVGSKSKHCTHDGCDEKTEVTEVPANGHTFPEEYITDTEPTCTEVGSKSKHCTVDGCDGVTDVTEIPAKGHSFTNYVSDDNATCDTDGTETAKCDNCDETDTKTIVDSHLSVSHNWVLISTINSTCTEKGSETYECSNCHIKEVKDIDPLGHEYSEDFIIDKEATCTEAGSKSKHCTHDGCAEKTEVTEVPAKGHTYSEDYTIDLEPTCTEVGSKSRYCTVDGCDGVTDVTEIPAKGHSFTNYVSDNNATCISHGTLTAKCDNCDETSTIEDEESELGEHVIVKKNYKAPSFDSPGYSGDMVCSICGEVIETGKETPKLEADAKKEEVVEYIMDVVKPATEDTVVKVEEALDAITEEKLVEISVTVSGATSTLEKELELGEITQEVYEQRVEIVQAVAEAAVIVSATEEITKETVEEITAVFEEAKIEINLSDALAQFIERQMALLLNKSGVKLMADDDLTKLDYSISAEEYRAAVEMVENSVNNMMEACLLIRQCSSEKLVAQVNDYVVKVSMTVFRDYDKEAADEEFVKNAYTAILINLQEQTLASIKKEYDSSMNKAAIQSKYDEEVALVSDLETFELIVIEIMRLKFITVINNRLDKYIITKDEYNVLLGYTADIDSFSPIYKEIFRSWALNYDNDYNITLEELSKTVISEMVAASTNYEIQEKMYSTEIVFISIFAGIFTLTVIVGAVVLVIKDRRDYDE